VALLEPQEIQLGFLKVLPGTPLFSEARQIGLCYSPEPPYEILASDAMTFAELTRLKAIAATLDRYQNSGAFPVTLPWLIRQAASPFAFFSGLADALAEGGWLKRPMSQKTRAALLQEYGSSLLKPETREILRSRLRLDYLLQGAKDEPEFLQRPDQAADPLIRERYRQAREQIRQQHPGVSRCRLAGFTLDEPVAWPLAAGKEAAPEQPTVLPAGEILCGFALTEAGPRLLFLQKIR
jgi:anaerobic magnesium-protoporphyrin IX monomethyl ester cyclase